MAAILEVQNLTKNFGDFTAVKGISFNIEEGEVFSLLGPNGAGKSTTISMLSCLLEPSGGEARVGGFSVNENPMEVKRIIGVVPQEIAVDSDDFIEELQRRGIRVRGL